MSKYTKTIQRLCAALQAASRTMMMTDDNHRRRRALAELATWLRVLGFKADTRLDHLRVFGQELRFVDDLWHYNGAIGSRGVAIELTQLSEEEAPRKGDDQLTPYAWEDGTRLTRGELRAWLRS
jgi:hypothetical protein